VPKIDIYEKGARLGVYVLTEWEHGEKSGTHFDRCGRAYVNRDGSLNIYLNLLPAKGQTVQVRVDKPREESGSDKSFADRYGEDG
jgi:hypothetical protein